MSRRKCKENLKRGFYSGSFLQDRRWSSLSQFLRKEPFAQKTPERRRGKLMGFRVEEFGSSS
jgi:hypothetical protein